MKVIIAGGRDFDDYALMKRKLDHLFSKRKPDEIVEGDAIGADKNGGRYAQENNIRLTLFPVTKEDWDTKGKAAGPIRNQAMADYCNPATDACIVFWDGVSRGTKNMIETAKKKGLDVRVVYY